MTRRAVLLTLIILSTALVGYSAARAEFNDWAFDQDVFQARLMVDWLAQDVPDEQLRARVFTVDATLQEQFDVLDAALGEVEDSQELRAKLQKLRQNDVACDDPQWRELYQQICQVRRRARLAELLEEYPQIVYTKHYVMGASHYAYTEDVTDEAYNDYSNNRQPGGQLCLATLQQDGTARHEVLVSTEQGTLRDPDVSWDGKRILFSMRTSFDDDDFHLYEYDLQTRQTRQITFGLGVADIEPCYLPNGDILFISTRCGQNTDCWWTEVSNLYTCDAQGRFLRRVSVDQVTVNYPKVMSDGRVTYTRWDYNDRGHIYVQPLFQMNPDGTGQTEFYGNNSYFPTSILHARGIPGSDKVVALASGHHTYQQGKLILIDRSKGTQGNSGVTLIAPTRETPNDELVDRYGQEGELFQYPYPLDEQTLLCAYLPEGSQERSYAVPYGLYWFDHDGRRELLAFDPAISCGQPVPLAQRQVPLMRPSQVDLAKTTGQYYVQDVYEGPGLQGVPRGTIKALRVVELVFRPFAVGWNWNYGEAGDSIVTAPVAVGNGTWDVKRVLGEAPVEEDGSAFFEVPAMTPVYFQLLDAKGNAVQTMRSWSTLQPGETFACVGCHEPKGAVGENALSGSSTTVALQKGVAKLQPVLTPPAGAYQAGGFDFIRDVQPILDHNCVTCHTGRERADGSHEPFSLMARDEVITEDDERASIYKEEKRRFCQSYLTLTQNGRYQGRWTRWYGTQERPSLLPPYHAGAAISPLMALLRDEHGNPGGQDDAHRDVKLDPKDLRILAMWIDLLVPYLGDYYEENRWTDGERAYYYYYLQQRERNAEIVRDNIAKKLEALQTGREFKLEDFQQFDRGGKAFRKEFVNALLGRKIPSLAYKVGEENVYRNVALNPFDVQGDAFAITSYPHAFSNSEYARADCFAAKNVIDGQIANTGHGENFPSWGPNLRDDLWLEIQFGCDVEIDKAVLYLRADFPHDDVWQNVTLEFSDGSRVQSKLEHSAEPQVITFPKRRVNSVRLVDLTPSFPLKWRGITEAQFWGVSVEEQDAATALDNSSDQALAHDPR
ncbi:MAG: hypothetical protein Q4G03_01490 [Planctomycetia bacterium]|nr:hypothetical protein [Planctomycetia bacterium]